MITQMDGGNELLCLKQVSIARGSDSVTHRALIGGAPPGIGNEGSNIGRLAEQSSKGYALTPRTAAGVRSPEPHHAGIPKRLVRRRRAKRYVN